MAKSFSARVRAQFFRSSRERIDWNFHARSLPILLIWPNYGTGAFSCDSVTAIFLACSRALPNSPALPGVHRLPFSCVTASNIRHFVQLGYLCNFTRSREGQSFSVRARVRKFLGPPGIAPVSLFARDRVQYSSFCPIGVPV